MKIGEAISYTRSLSGNAVDDNTLCRWLSELDGRLMLDFYKGSEWMSYALPQDEDHELLVPFPWDELYVHYLEAMVYYSNGEFERYRNSYEMYNKKELDYRQWYARNQLPVRLEALARRDCTVVTEGRGSKPFWYLSAYALAVKHGFQGTELEWLETLVGPTGSTGPQGDPAGFGTVDATVDTTSGTPAVQVTADGPNTAKNIHFSFTGLKGTKGDKGNKGDTGLAVGSVVKTAGTGAPGTTDTYTVYLTDNTPVGTITVYNGQDGAGDFKADGSVPMTGNLQMGSHKLTGLAEGTADTDGVNKGQMDEAIAALTGEDIPTSGMDETTIAAALSKKADATPPEEYDLSLAEGLTGTAKYSKDQFGLTSVFVSISATSGTISSGTIGTLPAGFRPKRFVAAVIIGNSKPTSRDNRHPVVMQVGSDGEVSVVFMGETVADKLNAVLGNIHFTAAVN